MTALQISFYQFMDSKNYLFENFIIEFKHLEAH